MKYVIDIRNNVISKLPYAVPADTRQALKQEFGYNNVRVYEASEVTDKTAEGKAIFMPLQFEQLSYTDDVGAKVDMKRLYLPCVIVEPTLVKNVVKTTIRGAKLRGTVKEQTSLGDYSISIKGMLIGTDGKYPFDLVNRLKLYAESPKAIAVSHDLLTKLGVYSIVIEQMELPNKQGFENVQPFTLTCSSDIDIKLVFKNEQEVRSA